MARVPIQPRLHVAYRMFVVSIMCLSSGIVNATDVSAYGTLTSEYIYRGLDMSDRNPAVQIGVDVSITDNFFAGAWSTTVNLRNTNGGRDFEMNYYAGVHYSFTDRLSATATLLRYAYPGAEGSHKYEHNEGLLTVSWDSRYSIEYAYTDDARGLKKRATHLLLSTDWPMRNGWILSANVGRYDLSRIRLPAYVHGNIGLSTRLSRYTFDARIYGNEKNSDSRFDGQVAGTRLVFSLSASF